MDNRLVAGIAATTAALFTAFLLMEDTGRRKLALLAGIAIILVTAVAFVIDLGRETWRSFEDGA